MAKKVQLEKKTIARRASAKRAKAVVAPATPVRAPRKASAPKAERVVLTVQADPGSTVFLSGSFNNWDPAALKMIDKDGNGLYSVTVTLAPGIYEYKFVINGVCKHIDIIRIILKEFASEKYGSFHESYCEVAF